VSTDARARLVQVTARTNAVVTQILTRDISDRITITETVTGVSEDYFINGVSDRVTNGVLSSVYTLAPVSATFDTAVYWTLGTSTLGTDTLLAPF
jgi:hypothetical protein